MTVGYHELRGTKVPLKKPMLVSTKIFTLSNEDEEKDSKEIFASSSPSPSTVELDVIRIMRHAILFKTRPTALMSGNFHYLSR